MRDDVKELLTKMYARSKKYQTKNGKTFNLSLDEFLSLWTPRRCSTLAKKIDLGPKCIRGYMRDPEEKPVLGWKTKTAFKIGVMDITTAKIDMAVKQKWKFFNRLGEKHRPDSIELMKKPKSKDPEAFNRRSEGQRKRREREKKVKE